ncbi:LysR substrate-binding domain-containing protein [Azospirillum sp.]|uniref:LysR substrate-binding domain-containing protein n=1 Tax=Azospirillum sp. TaxID=34012 RepID=UPI003D708607
MTLHRLPPLNALRAFEAAARHGSFAAAANELCVTPGAVSRQIQTLERALRVPLFTRGHRQVSLTDVGARYFTRITGLFAELGRATEALQAESGRALIRVDCLPTLAMHWLLPRLGSFRRDHPEYEISLRTGLGPVDLSQDFDLAIRRNPAHFAGLAATPLTTERCLPVCSPAFARQNPIADVPDIARVTTIQIRAREDLWPAWCRAHGLPPTVLTDPLVVDQTFFAIQAAEDGLGLAVVPALLVERQLATNRLVTPLGGRAAVSGTYSLLEHARKPRPGATALRQWLIGEFAHADPAEVRAG